jgi:hypothetical protein
VGERTIVDDGSDGLPLPELHLPWFSPGGDLHHLGRRQHCEADPLVSQDLKRLVIDGSFGEPHSLRIAPESALKVRDPPTHLRHLVSPRGEGKDHVVVRRRYGISEPEAGSAPGIAIQKAAIGIGRGASEPTQERGSRVPTHPFEGVE